MELDDQIVALCHKGRQEGFARLLLTYQERVYRRAYSFVHNRDDALDLTQDVFMRVIRSIGTFAAGRPLWPWLRRITTNVCLNYLRDRPALLSLDDPDGPAEPAGGADPLESAINSWVWSQLQAALGRLPPLLRMAAVLRHQEGLSYEEVAQAMEIPVGTVKTYLFRARRFLKAELCREVRP
ncbi:MAG TPA: RNA polymerase sigma factor [Symbiobacteriaceae bacterium]|nr:RNA polymerase sigma factor [Symbiobacteriaceae bacterium]